MCGLFASNDPSVTLGNEAIVDRALKFRGPDSQSGLIPFGDWKIFHSRLAIIAPVEEYEQPYPCPDSSLLLFNGEIFNYRELSSRYLNQEFESDTATLAALLVLPEFNLVELDGFFAFVRISADGTLLNCARDHFGVKPLFLYDRNGYLTICSEPRAIRDLFRLPVSKKSLREYRLFRGPIFSGSYFKDVKQIPTGFCHVTGKFFDSVDYICDPIHKPVDLVEIRSAISSSIASRHVSDVPIGLLFSGGVDSNLVNFEERKVLTQKSIA